ncbi:MAG TPA: MAPEG family protein [Rhizomicrobium sp.]|nr:MAPEG family protein [Rhizomicrobium sp.]
MTIAEWMLLAAVLIYLLTIAPFKPLGYREFDNAKPRDPAFYAAPLRARALGAHNNGIETFPFFAVAVLLAEFRHAPQHLIDLLAIGFVLLRLAFVAAYLLNYPWSRTLIWNLGFAVNAAIFVMPLWAH